jgi:hypothetical protein
MEIEHVDIELGKVAPDCHFFVNVIIFNVFSDHRKILGILQIFQKKFKKLVLLVMIKPVVQEAWVQDVVLLF